VIGIVLVVGSSPRHVAFLGDEPDAKTAKGTKPASAPDGPAPFVEEEGVGPNLHFSPLSTTMKCTINLTIQYMAVFTALGICRSYLDFQQRTYEDSAVQKALKHASETVFYAPMACLLFVGFRMRVLQLTKGQGNPQDWVQLAMQGVAYSILANTVMVLLIPIFTDVKAHEIELEKNTGDLKVNGKNPFANESLATVFNCMRYACFLALYVGFVAVVAGLFMFEPDPNVWDGPVPEVSPAVFCTCILSCAFFAIYCLLAISRTYSQLKGGTKFTSKFEEVMLGAADTLAMAPMFCVLFLGARMRALQMDPVQGNPQRWAQNCFYLCSWALIVQCIVAITIPLVVQSAKVSKGAVEGDMQFTIGEDKEGTSMLAKSLAVFRWIVMLSIYGAGIAVVCSVFTIEHPDGPEYTPPISPTMQCVINLAFQYFLIYLLVWIFYTVNELTGLEDAADIKDTIESAKATVQFAPMLSVLFIATRMRALQITENRGSPQGFVQDGMYLATWAVMIQFLMCLILPFFTGKKYEIESLAGSDTPLKPVNVQNKYGAWAVTIIRYSALLALLGGVATVITGVFLMTPETANGRGSIPFVGKHVSRPPLATDMPGVKGAMEDTGENIGSSVDSAQETTEGAVAETTEEAMSVSDAAVSTAADVPSKVGAGK